MEERTRPIPRFNHVALSVPADSLDAESRAALLGFYGEVFGWTEMPTMTRNRELLILRAHSNEQFVYLHASEQPMRCSGMEHVGISVDTAEELDAIYERAKAYRQADARVELVDRTMEDYKAVKLHSFYVRYLLPLMFEVQCFDWAEGFSAERTA